LGLLEVESVRLEQARLTGLGWQRKSQDDTCTCLRPRQHMSLLGALVPSGVKVPLCPSWGGLSSLHPRGFLWVSAGP
jgi:hypothetical protein